MNEAGFTALLVACALILPHVYAFLVTISAMEINFYTDVQPSAITAKM